MRGSFRTGMVVSVLGLSLMCHEGAHSCHLREMRAAVVSEVSRPGGGLFDTRPTTQTESGAFVFLDIFIDPTRL